MQVRMKSMRAFCYRHYKYCTIIDDSPFYLESLYAVPSMMETHSAKLLLLLNAFTSPSYLFVFDLIPSHCDTFAAMGTWEVCCTHGAYMVMLYYSRTSFCLCETLTTNRIYSFLRLHCFHQCCLPKSTSLLHLGPCTLSQ